MKKRIITGVLGGIFIAIISIIGGIAYDFVYLGITLIAIYEIQRVLNKGILDYGLWINYLFAFILFILKINDKVNLFSFILFIYIALVFIVFIFDKNLNVHKITYNIFIGIYVTFFMYHMMLLNDTKFVWLVYIIAFGTDTCAYFTGVLLGKHKLYPEISPNKTIEGAIGGIIGCTIFSLLYFNYLGTNVYKIILFSIFASILSMLGDLTASKIKREFKIKDFGNILPGHGGILDRFDSVLFVAPIVYYFTNYFI